MSTFSLSWLTVAAMTVYGIGRLLFGGVMYRRTRELKKARSHKFYAAAAALKDRAESIKEKASSQRTFEDESTLRELDSLLYQAERQETEIEFLSHSWTSLWLMRLPGAALEFVMMTIVIWLVLGWSWPTTILATLILSVILYKLSWISEECGRIVQLLLSEKALRRSKEEGISFQNALKEMAQDRFQ
jgi:hypothetical protein